jgi:flotillin
MHFMPILIGQSPLDNLPGGVWSALMIGAAVLFLVVMPLMFIKSCMRRCSSNQVLVVYGLTGKGRTAKTIHGGATFVIPLLQDYRYLRLEPIQIETPLRGALSAENIRVNVPSVFTVAIGTSPDVMTNAAIRLLDLSTDQIRKQAEEIIFGQLRK